MLRRLCIPLLLLALAAALPATGRAALHHLDQGYPLRYPPTLPVTNVYWSPTWDDNQANFGRSVVDAGTKQLLDSGFDAGLRQYGVPSLTFAGGVKSIPECGEPSTTSVVTSTRIGAFLRCEIDNGQLPEPTPFLYTADHIYNVILPPGVSTGIRFLNFSGGNSCADFEAFHDSTAPPFPRALTTSIVYTAIPTECVHGDWNHLFANLTHELAEAATDPVPPLFWIDESYGNRNDIHALTDPSVIGALLTHGEASDLCEDPPEFQHVPFASGGFLYRLAAYWSNEDNACVVMGFRTVLAQFAVNGPSSAHVQLEPGAAELKAPGRIGVVEGSTFNFERTIAIAPGERWFAPYDSSGCGNLILFPTDGTFTQHYTCTYRHEYRIDFVATGLPDGTPFSVSVNGYPATGGSAWVTAGDTARYSFGAVPGFVLTDSTPASGFTVTGPATVTATYAPAGPPVAATYAQTVLADGPIAYWRLGDSGTAALDSTGNGNDGTYVGGVTLGSPGALAGDADTAAAFDGSDGHVTAPAGGALDLTGDAVTIECWVKGAAQPAFTYLLSKSDWHGTLGYSLYTGPSATLRFFVGLGGAAVTPDVGFPWDGAWHHVVGTYDGTAVRLYVDGAEVASAPAAGNILDSSGRPLTLGRFNEGQFPYGGALDEVAVYGYALSAAQVGAHYARGTTP